MEFKKNYHQPDEIGKIISALSNSAVLHEKSFAYIIWGVDDSTHRICGTDFQPGKEKKGHADLEIWLSSLLNPRIDFRFVEDNIENNRLVVLIIPPAPRRPVSFHGVEYIRVGSCLARLAEHPEKEREIWRLFSKFAFEDEFAAIDYTSDNVFEAIDYPRYFELMNLSLPDNRAAIISRLNAEKVITCTSENRYSITNLGAMLYAKDLNGFEKLQRKALRVIIYKGSDRTETVREQTGGKGYAVGFRGAIEFIDNILPQNEEVGKALRREVKTYPVIAIRELMANALIHQDFAIRGSGPMVEIFSDRIEISNPGVPLIDPLRFIDEPPRSRNEALASLMRRMQICEERGSGIDKVINSVELFQLPPPDFRVAGSSTVAVLYGPRGFNLMDSEERIRACYQHACLLYVSGKRMTNATLRKRLGIEDRNYPIASRIIKGSIDKGLVKPYGGDSDSKRDAAYVPFWA